ncbi:hypothetical protein EDC04DRAFT_2651319 [Pisolithus marmoratus]|nr:hypothetical protein EDC04DRAFT_2651319 [Pisolithus marmoratus]
MQPETTQSYLEHLEETRTGFGFDGTEHDMAEEEASSSCLRTRSAEGYRNKLPTMSRPWTPTEKNAFFRALSVYSRWRPDLIAAAVPTRSALEVDLYLVALEEGAQRLERAENGGESLSDLDVDEEDSGFDSELEPAYEVSDAWVGIEESLASYIIEGENSALLERYRNPFSAEKGKAKRRLGRPRIGGGSRPRYRRRGARRFASDVDAQSQGRVDSQREGETQAHQSSVARQVQTMSSDGPLPKRPRLGKREDYLTCLGDAHLRVLDSILRDDEESAMMEMCRREYQDAASPLSETWEGDSPDRKHEREMQTVTNVIDTELLAMSGVPGNTTSTMTSVPTTSTTGTGRSPPASSGPPPTKATVTHDARQDTVDVVQSGFRAANEAPAMLNLDLLSPILRRRLQNRLYMRRRRAKLKGKQEASYSTTESESADIGWNVPKDKSRGTTPESPTPTSDVESDNDKPTKAKRYLTLHTKLRSMYSKLDIDAAYLRAQGMDLLHLSALTRLMSLFTAFECGSPSDDASTNEVEEELPFAIDAALIQQLQAAVVFFVTDVIYRAIMWKEGQVRLKQAVWGNSDQILTVNVVKRAVETLGVRYKSHKEFFAEFYSRNHAESRGTKNETEATHHFNRSTDLPTKARDEGGCEDGDPAVPMLSTHSDLYMSLIRPPSVLGVHPLDCFSRTYMREATVRADRAGEEEADWMSSETDEEALDAELREDEALDDEDMENAAEYEEILWETLGDASDTTDEGPCT